MHLRAPSHQTAHIVPSRPAAKTALLASAVLITLVIPAQADQTGVIQPEAGPHQQLAESRKAPAYNIPAGSLSEAIDIFARQSNQQVIHQLDLNGLENAAVSGNLEAQEALKQLLRGTGYEVERIDTQTLMIREPAGSASAGTINNILPEIVVSATRTAEDKTTLATNVIVIERDEIERQAAISRHPGKLLEKYVPGYGMSTGQNSSSGENFRGRGLLVLVDGISRNTPLRNVTRTMSVIDLNQIERIEIVPGSNATYGNSATGGTVNFITRSAADGRFEHSIDTSIRMFTADPEDSLAPKISLATSGSRDGYSYSLSGSFEKTQNQFDGNGNQLASDAMIGQGNLDNARNIDLLGKLGYDLQAGQNITGSYNIIRRRQDPEYFTDFTTDPINVDRDNPYTGAAITEKSGHGNVKYTANDTRLGDIAVTFHRDDINKTFSFSQISAANPLVLSTGPGSTTPDPSGQSMLDIERYGARTTVDSSLDFLVSGLEATWGLDLAYETVNQKFLSGQERIAPMTQKNYAPFVQLNVPVNDRLRLRGGARYERYDLKIDDFRRPDIAYRLTSGAVVPVPGRNVIGGDFTYDELVFNAAAILKTTRDSEAYGSFSQGFSLPDIGSFTARAGITTPFATTDIDYSDLNIKAAVVDTFEAGYRSRKDKYAFEASAFMSKSDFGTNFDAATETLVQQKERIYGAEFAGEWFYDEETTLGTVLAYTEGKRDTDNDGSLDAYLPNNRIGAPFRATLYADKTFASELSLRGEAVYSGSRFKNDGSAHYKLGSTVTFNLAAQYPLWDGTVSAGIENILDRDQKNPAASASRNTPIPGLGRTITLGYRKTF